MNIKKDKNESNSQFIWRICSDKDDGLIDLSWKELGAILNQELYDDINDYVDESALRKQYQAAKKFYDEVFKNMLDDNILKEINIQKDELKKERYRLLDERSEYNRKLRNDARLEDRLDKLEASLMSQGAKEFPVTNNDVTTTSDNDLLVLLGDMHIGQSFDSFMGKYNTDIATERLTRYLNEICKIAKLHGSQNCYLSLQGDLISGSIHKSIQVSNGENVINQIKIASDLISYFVYELSKHFKTVRISSVSGNHSRLDRKEDALKDERMDDIPIWYMKAKLFHLDNIEFEIEYDNTFATMKIRDKMYVNLHGDYDTFDKKGLSDLMLMLGWIPDVVTYGHKHFPAYYYIGDTQIIQNGSLVGAGDDYTIERRLNGKANQTVLVCTDAGVVAHYPVVLE